MYKHTHVYIFTYTHKINRNHYFINRKHRPICFHIPCAIKSHGSLWEDDQSGNSLYYKTEEMDEINSNVLMSLQHLAFYSVCNHRQPKSSTNSINDTKFCK